MCSRDSYPYSYSFSCLQSSLYLSLQFFVPPFDEAFLVSLFPLAYHGCSDSCQYTSNNEYTIYYALLTERRINLRFHSHLLRANYPRKPEYWKYDIINVSLKAKVFHTRKPPFILFSNFYSFIIPLFIRGHRIASLTLILPR